MSSSIKDTIGGVEVPDKLVPMFIALLHRLMQADRDKTTGSMALEMELQDGGVRYKAISVRTKIQ